MSHYPIYYQKGSICIKRETPTTGKQVIIPGEHPINSFGFQRIITKDKLNFDSIVDGMKEVSFDVYETYLITLHQFNQRQPSGFRESHEFSPEFDGSPHIRPGG